MPAGVKEEIIYLIGKQEVGLPNFNNYILCRVRLHASWKSHNLCSLTDMRQNNLCHMMRCNPCKLLNNSQGNLLRSFLHRLDRKCYHMHLNKHLYRNSRNLQNMWYSNLCMSHYIQNHKWYYNPSSRHCRWQSSWYN